MNAYLHIVHWAVLTSPAPREYQMALQLRWFKRRRPFFLSLLAQLSEHWPPHLPPGQRGFCLPRHCQVGLFLDSSSGPPPTPLPPSALTSRPPSLVLGNLAWVGLPSQPSRLFFLSLAACLAHHCDQVRLSENIISSHHGPVYKAVSHLPITSDQIGTLRLWIEADATVPGKPRCPSIPALASVPVRPRMMLLSGVLPSPALPARCSCISLHLIRLLFHSSGQAKAYMAQLAPFYLQYSLRSP